MNEDLSLPTANTLRRLDLEGELTDNEHCILFLNGGGLGELLAHGLPHEGRNRRKWGRVRITVERIGE